MQLEDQDTDVAWHRLTHHSALCWLRQQGPFEHRPEFLALLRPMVALAAEPFPEAVIAVGSSKFGGSPDLPPDYEWPGCERGPLGFLVQFSLRDLHGTLASAELGLPADGLLLVFARQEYESGYCPGTADPVPGDLKIVSVPSDAELRRRVPPPLGNGNGPFPSALVKMLESLDFPPDDHEVPTGSRKSLKAVSAALRPDGIHDFRRRMDGYGHHLFGYPVHLHGTDSVPKGYVHFLTLSSDQVLGWHWQDDHHLSIYVHPDDIANRSFSRVHCTAL